MAELIHDPAVMRERVLAARAAGRRVGFIPTMGALHAGHVSLVERAARECDDVAVSIFVNPMQFGPHEDFDRYPRVLQADRRVLETQRVAWIFAPDVAAMYPLGNATQVVISGPAEPFEGVIRPGHFAGVATIVLKLFHMVPSQAAYFGAKDWQQTRVVIRMVQDLAVPIDIVVCPTVREPDGLAMSSRNAYLSAADRVRAAGLAESLVRAEQCWRFGASVAETEAAMRETLERQGIAIDYAAVVDAESLATPIPTADSIALVAGRLGATRLIDNRLLPVRAAL